MRDGIRSSDLAHMTEAERRQALTSLVDAARHDSASTRVRLEQAIHELEARYEMTSDEMRWALAAGTLKDTADISRWLVLLKALGCYTN